MPVIKARTEFASALNQICAERGIDPNIVLETVQEAVLAAYKRDFGVDESLEYQVEIDEDSGGVRLFAWEVGKKKSTKKEITPPGFGRIAAQVAKQVLLQKIREAEKVAILDEFSQKMGSLINGLILRFEGPNVIVDIGKTEALMPPQEQVRAEGYKLSQRLIFYLVGIEETEKGKQIIVSRANKGLIEALFKREVPEVSSGAVQIREVAREPGSRTKIAVLSTQAGVDPVGSCVGQKGVRVQAVIDELGGEKIDVIQYSEDKEKFIASSLSPAENISVRIDEKTKSAIVSAPDDQLSLAIGREGQNVRLASKLTGYKIDIKEKEEAKPKKKTAKSKKQKEEVEEDKIEKKAADKAA